MASKVPSSWDEEDWDKLAERSASTPSPPSSRRPNPAAPPFNPPQILRATPEFDHPLLYTTTTPGQPKTLYKPELKILKRSSPDAPSCTIPAIAPSEEPEKERRERELKEKARRYKEARDRIMGDAVPVASSPAATQVAHVDAGKTSGKKTGNGKRTPESNSPSRAASTASNTHKSTPPLSSPRGPSPVPRPSRAPSRTQNRKPPAPGESTPRDPLRSRTPNPSMNRSSSPPGLGAVTSLSLNGGGFAAAPVSHSNRLYSHKVDEKLLESQFTIPDGGEDGEACLGGGARAEVLDWDSFSRDKGWDPQQQQLQQWEGYAGGGGDYGYGYTTAATGASYDYSLQFQPRQQNPAIYGGSAAMDAQAQGRFNVFTDKQGRAPGTSQCGVVQAIRAPRGPDSDGGPGFKGRGAARGAIGIAGKMKLQEGGVREFVPGGSVWGQ